MLPLLMLLPLPLLLLLLMRHDDNFLYLIKNNDVAAEPSKHSISLLTAVHNFLLQNWHAIISSSLASLLLLGISTLIAIALAIHTELMPKKYLQIGSKPATPTKRQRVQEREKDHERERERELESLSNITQIRAQSPPVAGANRGPHRPPPKSASSQCAFQGGSAGIRGAIGISWLLPLLAVAAPLICSIIGQWPRHWWLEVLWLRGAGSADAKGDGGGGSELDGGYYSTHSLLNGDNLLLESEALLGNGTSSTTETSSPDDVATSTSSITGGHSYSSILSREQQLPATWRGSSRSSSTSFATSVSALAAPLTSGLGDGTSTASPSLSFLLFACIDLLFILLFFALFAILMKKLLWLRHKNRNVHTHPLDKFNLALRRR